jgi:hypothetical protein
MGFVLNRYFADQGGSWSVVDGVLRQRTPVDPGSNGWVGNPDPVTIIGDNSWTDVVVTAAANFGEDYGGSSSRSNNNSSSSSRGSGVLGGLIVESCEVAAKHQNWTRDDPELGYYQNALSSLCLNTCVPLCLCRKRRMNAGEGSRLLVFAAGGRRAFAAAATLAAAAAAAAAASLLLYLLLC